MVGYWKICKEATDLMVTLSCFAVWNENKKRNAHAKVIPAIPAGRSEAVRVFFFDDNLALNSEAGKADSPGICALRHINTGEFVEFGEGVNGFRSERLARHSVVNFSSEYKVVLVQANIIDSMEKVDYFTSCIQRYSKPGEKCVVFMDINSTIVSNDAITGKHAPEILLSSMFEFILATPAETFTFEWESLPQVEVNRAITLKKLVKQLTEGNKTAYTHFYSIERCLLFIEKLGQRCCLKWNTIGTEVTLNDFRDMYDECLRALAGSTNKDGVTKSWYHTHEFMQRNGHALILNSFGIDSKKVVMSTVNDHTVILRVLVNFSRWDRSDADQVRAMFDLHS
eukprot:CAMPEP_0172722140 /NCGR_PEP_ID=MMETSP1074-20121228/80768_1 /TAXON_ID=2916 /ORGANISM="Ceratium fusus, Strain PA161109" /LENGTH=339 /DNA_ID=CAMNT_0013548069 /DNA_START=174 /DNA_END=1193 /DNA_ORIENTATION=-